LEAKTVDTDGRSIGLNLTRASLDAATKYPWQRATNPRKFGVYDDDVEIYKWMRADAPEGKRCIEAQIMDWSDDVSYSVHDLEDAIVANQIHVRTFEDDFDSIYASMTEDYGSNATKAEATEALIRLQELSCWPINYNGSHRSLARLKDSTSQLVGRFVVAAENKTRAIYGDEPLARYGANLEIPREQLLEVDFLKAVAGHYLIRAAESQERYAKQKVVVVELVDLLYQSAPKALDAIFIDDWNRAADDGQRLRVVIDQIAALTDPGAYALHARLTQNR
jgi:dGTPase